MDTDPAIPFKQPSLKSYRAGKIETLKVVDGLVKGCRS